MKVYGMKDGWIDELTAEKEGIDVSEATHVAEVDDSLTDVPVSELSSYESFIAISSRAVEALMMVGWLSDSDPNENTD